MKAMNRQVVHHLRVKEVNRLERLLPTLVYFYLLGHQPLNRLGLKTFLNDFCSDFKPIGEHCLPNASLSGYISVPPPRDIVDQVGQATAPIVDSLPKPTGEAAPKPKGRYQRAPSHKNSLSLASSIMCSADRTALINGCCGAVCISYKGC